MENNTNNIENSNFLTKFINKHPIVKFSLNAFKKNIHVYLLLSLGVTILSLLQETTVEHHYSAQLVITIATFLLSMILVKAFLKNQDKEKLEWSDIWITWKDLWSFISTMFVYGFAVSIGIGIVIAIEYFLLNTTPLVLPIIVGIISVLGLFYVIIRMSFLQIIAFDKQNSSLKKRLLHSWNITKGSVSKTVALVVAAGLFNMIGLLFFGIGTIVTLPITGLALAFFYKKLDNAYSQEPEQVQELATEITQNNFEE